MAVRPEFGPTLPALLRARGWSSRAMVGAVVVLVAGAIGLVVLIKHVSHTRHLTVHSPVAFTFTYDRTVMHPAATRGGELMRLEGRHSRRLSATIIARHVTFPPFKGDLVGGYLPVHAEARVDALRHRYPGLQILDEGKGRTNDAPGYQIDFRVLYGNRRVIGRDVYALKDATGERGGILIVLRVHLQGKATDADHAWIKECDTISRSFIYGTSPA